jgi:hypothetical protein
VTVDGTLTADYAYDANGNLVWAGVLWITGGWVILASNVLALAVVLLSAGSDFDVEVTFLAGGPASSPVAQRGA